MSVDQVTTVVSLGEGLVKLGAGLAAGLGAIGGGIGIGFATSGFLSAVARQPEILGKAMPYFFVGAALSEATAIYGLFIALQLLG